MYLGSYSFLLRRTILILIASLLIGICIKWDLDGFTVLWERLAALSARQLLSGNCVERIEQGGVLLIYLVWLSLAILGIRTGMCFVLNYNGLCEVISRPIAFATIIGALRFVSISIATSSFLILAGVFAGFAKISIAVLFGRFGGLIGGPFLLLDVVLGLGRGTSKVAVAVLALGFL